jgi:hypothetical protein
MIAVTAAVAFIGGLWTGATLAVSKPISNPPTVSPSALHLQVKPAQLPSTTVEHYN